MARRSGGKTRREIIVDALAAASAGAIAATFVCPLDVIRTGLMVHGLPDLAPAPSSSSTRRSIIVTSLTQIIRNEGVSGLYRGLTPTVAALLPNWAVYFVVYNQLKRLLHSHDKNSELSFGAHMIAASGAGAATAIATNPLWVVKIRLQTQGMRSDVVPYKGILSALRRITLEEGRKGLYSGLVPSLVGVSHVAIQFPAYEKFKSYLARKENTTVDNLNPKEVVIASSLSKIIASTVTYPHEVVRAKLQEQGHGQNNNKKYDGTVDCIVKTFQKEGGPAFYRGYATNLLRTIPANVITFMSYEMIRRFFNQIIPT